MLRKRRLTTILISCLLLIALSANILTLAYFQFSDIKLSDNTTSITPGDKNTDVNVIAVENYSQLVNASRDTAHNSDNAVGIRKTIMLSGDIRLANNLSITADVNLDINGKVIDLNGYKMTIRHRYSGMVNIYNGTITSSANVGNIVYDLPKAKLVVNNVIYDSSVVATNLVFSAATLVGDVFEMIARSIEGEFSSRENYNASGVALQSKNRLCNLHGEISDDNQCNYIYGDIDLPFNYYGYSAEISYISSAPQVLANNGMVNMTNVDDRADVVLTASVKHEGIVYSKAYSLHVVNYNHTTVARQAAIVELGEYLERYYYVGSQEDGGAVVKLYNIVDEISLPRYSIYGGCEYEYWTLAADGSVVDYTGDINKSSFDIDKDNPHSNYQLNVTNEASKLRISVVGTGEYVDLEVSGNKITVIPDHYTRALAIMKELYGDNIIIKKDAAEYQGFTNVALSHDLVKYYLDDTITVKYSLPGGQIYSITNINGVDTLHVTSGDNPPSEIQSLPLKAEFTFSSMADSVQVSINTPIVYKPETDPDGNIIDRFFAYYRFFDKIFSNVTGNYTYKTFSMPFGYEYGEPIFYYEVYNENGDINNQIITQELKYTTQTGLVTKSLAEVKRMTTAEIADIHRLANAKWVYSINISAVPLTDSHLKLRYIYKFADYSGEWLGGDPNKSIYESKLIVPGVIKKGSGNNDYIADMKLYEYVYNMSHPLIPSNNSIATNPYRYNINTSDYIIYSWLNNAERLVEIDNSNKALVSADYAGIQLLKNVKTLNLRGAVYDISKDAAYIAGMSGLVTLNLSNNGENVRDRNAGFLNFPSGSGSKFLATLSVLPNLENLYIEGNRIYYFNDLTKFASLKVVHLYDNKFPTSFLGNLINDLYGSSGLVNSATFNRLAAKGMLIYNVNSTDPYVPSAQSNKIIIALSNIAYLERLPYGVSIVEAYKHLSTTPSDYIAKQTSVQWTSSSTSDRLEYAVVGNATEATEFYSKFTYYRQQSWITSTVAIEIEVYFEVVRY